MTSLVCSKKATEGQCAEVADGNGLGHTIAHAALRRFLGDFLREAGLVAMALGISSGKGSEPGVQAGA